jgi:hypothetical protein
MRGLEIHSATAYSWQGRRSPALPRNVAAALTTKSAKAFLLAGVQATLYNEFYVRGGAFPGGRNGSSFDGVGRTPFVERLSAANAGSGVVESGWSVTHLEQGSVVLHRAGLDVWVHPDECITADGRPPRSGDAVGLRLPPEHLQVSPGYYLALAEADFPVSSTERIVRLYWNLLPAGAETFIRAATTILNAAGLAFRAKVLNNADRFHRCDAGVLYVPRSEYVRHRQLIADVHRQVAPRLRRRTPVFTKRLAPGVGLAEDDGTGRSFGMERCRLLAEAAVTAHERGKPSLRGKVEAGVARFDQAGVDIARPYLRPGSSEDYEPLLVLSGSVARVAR